MKFKTFKSADVSTGHMQRSDDDILREILDSESRYPLLVVGKDCGYFVHCAFASEKKKELVERGFSQVLVNLLLIAEQQGCKWIEFDADGEGYSQLPSFEW